MKRSISSQKYSLLILMILLSSSKFIQAQETDLPRQRDEVAGFELYLIDSYVRSNDPSKLVLSWMTNTKCKSEVKIDEFGTFPVSDTLTDIHSIVIDISDFKKSDTEASFRVVSILDDSTEIESEDFTFIIPTKEEQTIEKKFDYSYYFYTCCVGGSLWLVPSPGLVFADNELKYSISKEIPLVSFGSASAYKEYPYGFISTGYTHNLKGQVQNLFRFGYKQIFEIKSIFHYLSLGMNGFTNFKGVNGISPEVSVSILRILSTFDLYLLYRFDSSLSKVEYSAHNIQIGLFTSSFSLNLNF